MTLSVVSKVLGQSILRRNKNSWDKDILTGHKTTLFSKKWPGHFILSSRGNDGQVKLWLVTGLRLSGTPSPFLLSQSVLEKCNLGLPQETQCTNTI